MLPARLLDMFLRADLEGFVCVPSLRQKAVSCGSCPSLCLPISPFSRAGRHTHVPWQSSAGLCEAVPGKDEGLASAAFSCILEDFEAALYLSLGGSAFAPNSNNHYVGRDF